MPRTLNTAPLNSTRRTYAASGGGAASVYTGFSGAAAGGYRVGYESFSLSGGGAAGLFNAFALAGSGAALQYGSFAVTGCGGFEFSGLLYTEFAASGCGAFALSGYSALSAAGVGGFGFYQQGIACGAPGLYRVANAWPEYELYRAVDGAAMDFGASPWATAAALPITTPALDPGHTYAFVLRRRNPYGLGSQNMEEWAVTVDAAGAVDAVHPSAPSFVVAPAAGGRILITAAYPYSTDGDHQGDTWAIWIATTGAPDPEADSPEEIAMVKADELARLSYTTDAQAEGTVVRVLVRVARSADGAQSENTTILSALATLAGPAEPVGGVYY